MTIRVEGPRHDVTGPCETLLRSLPEWFGIESAIEQYARDIAALPTFIAGTSQKPDGFLTVRRHYPEAAEIHVMAVERSQHRRGIGRALVHACEAWLAADECRYLQVKTLGPGRPCEHYAGTRAFYHAIGFVPLEEFPTLWDPRNPCLLMIKTLDGASP